MFINVRINIIDNQGSSVYLMNTGENSLCSQLNNTEYELVAVSFMHLKIQLICIQKNCTAVL
jgi:hypothetical protein